MAKKYQPSKPFLRTRSNPFPSRNLDTLELRQRFLIVCQGTKTEPNYFNRFRVPLLILKVIGSPVDPYRLVCRAIEYREKTDDEYNQVWVVFDCDDTPKDTINKALDLAKRSDIQTAYSNQAFELWYLLHFQYLSSAQTRQDYIRKLEYYLDRVYDKTDDSLFDILYPRQPEAISNAERLLEEYHPLRPVEDDPSTTVHLLVIQLNRFQR